MSVFQMFVNLPKISQLEVLDDGLGLGIEVHSFFSFLMSWSYLIHLIRGYWKKEGLLQQSQVL